MNALLAETERARQEAAQWRELAMRHAPPPQPTYQQQAYEPAIQRASSFQEPSFPDANLAIENPAEYNRQLRDYIAFSNQQSVQQASGAIRGATSGRR